jgi:hypothetical protein
MLMRDLITLCEQATSDLWYHGTSEAFDDFDLDQSIRQGVWFSSSSVEARAFACDKARVPLHNPRNVPLQMIVARLNGRIKTLDLLAMAQEIADQIGVPAPNDWDEAKDIIMYGDTQGDMIDEAKAEGFDAVRFTGIADNALGIEADQVAVMNPAIIQVVDRKTVT